MLSAKKQVRICCRAVSFIRTQALPIIAMMAVMFMAGCSQDVEHKAPNLTGTFNTALPDGKQMTITLQQNDNIVSGHGVVDSKSFSVSGVTSIHGPLVIAFENGHVERSSVALTQRGKTAQIKWLGKTVLLKRGGDPVSSSLGILPVSMRQPIPILYRYPLPKKRGFWLVPDISPIRRLPLWVL